MPRHTKDETKAFNNFKHLIHGWSFANTKGLSTRIELAKEFLQKNILHPKDLQTANNLLQQMSQALRTAR